MYLLFYIEGGTKKHSSKWLEGVDIKYKNKFRHKGCFSLLILSVRNSNCIYIRTNFGTKVVFHYLFCQLEIQIVIHVIFQIVS